MAALAVPEAKVAAAARTRCDKDAARRDAGGGAARGKHKRGARGGGLVAPRWNETLQRRKGREGRGFFTSTRQLEKKKNANEGRRPEDAKRYQ